MANARTDGRHHVVSIRLTGEEAARIDAAAARMSPRRTRGDWVRAVALRISGSVVPEPVTPRRRPARRTLGADLQSLARILAQIGKIGSNVNQIARIANTAARLPTTERLDALTKELTALRDDLRAALRPEGDDGD